MLNIKTKNYLLKLPFLLWLTLFILLPLAHSTRIKDIAKIRGPEEEQLIGYGLVVGLRGTGDSPRTIFTAQTIINMLERMGISISQPRLRAKNVAAVMVTTTLPPYVEKGNSVDVTVSSLGDAKGLDGGTLLLTPLRGPDGKVWVTAQGPVSTGGAGPISSAHLLYRARLTTVGRIPDGGLVRESLPEGFVKEDKIYICLNQPDFTSAWRIALAINKQMGEGKATPRDAGLVEVDVPEDSASADMMVGFVSQLENLQVIPDAPAKVVINERTGTVVVGENVEIAPVAVAHKGLKLEIISKSTVSQPGPFSLGQTAIITEPQGIISEQGGKLFSLPPSTTVGEVADALNTLGLSPREIITIFQALKEAGALHARLVII